MQELIEKARHRREGLLGSGTNAFRLFDGRGDGRAGVCIDAFAGHWLVQTREDRFPGELAEMRAGGCRSLWWKKLEQGEKSAPTWKWGQRPEQPFAVLENGCSFLIDFQAGYSQGLFLDQRLNRATVRRRCGPEMEILNCFAYTCGFSVAGAMEGARTTSVDISRGSLEWGRRNFAINGLDAGRHRFQREDTTEWLRREARRGRAYRGVILDPPTFARNRKGKVFRVEKDYAALVEMAARVVEPDGWILCCTNCRSLEEEAFAAMLRSGIRGSGRRISDIHRERMPPEYRGEKYLKSYWIELA